MSYVLQTNQLTKTIGGKNLVKNVSLYVKKGEIYGFLGPNGAGKTTMMKLITNLWKPTEGTVELFGEVLTPKSYEVLGRMGSLIEFPYLFIFAMAFLGIANDPDGTLDAAEGMDTISSSIELLTSMSFLILTSVMLAAFIVSAYQNRTMNLMFSYPIKRQKILASQMAAVWIFNFAGLAMTKLLLYSCVYLGARRMSSFVLIFLTQANVGDYTLAGNAVFPVILTVVSLVFAGLSIYRVEQRDV